MLFLSGLFLIRCGSICGQGTTHWAQLYELYLILFVDSSLYFGGSLVQIAISFQLYFSITQRFKRLNNVSPNKVMLVFLVVSFVFGTSILFSFKASVNHELTIYANGNVEWNVAYRNSLDWSNKMLVYIALFFLIISNKIFLVILIIINVLLYVELRKIMTRKKKLVSR